MPEVLIYFSRATGSAEAFLSEVVVRWASIVHWIKAERRAEGVRSGQVPHPGEEPDPREGSLDDVEWEKLSKSFLMQRSSLEGLREALRRRNLAPYAQPRNKDATCARLLASVPKAFRTTPRQLRVMQDLENQLWSRRIHSLANQETRFGAEEGLERSVASNWIIGARAACPD